MSLFHYVTYKYIIIKDKRLGVAYYVLAFVIVLYTLVQLLVNKSYLQYDFSPNGNMRILVNTPMKLQNEENNYNARPSYCNASSINEVKSNKKSTTFCRKLDGLFLNWPVESRAVTLATYIKEKWQRATDCAAGLVYDPENPVRFEDLREEDYYTVNPEFALVKIEHSFTAFTGSLTHSHRKMSGSLVDDQGNTIKRLNSNGVSKVDKILLKDLLKAANVSLDAESDALNAKGRTFRDNGLILHVSILYKNSEKSLFGVSVPEYTYHVRRVLYSDYRLKQEIPIANNEGRVCERLMKKRYAVRMEFHQGGKIGKFSSGNLVLQLVSVMGLLTLTATVIDIIALYIVPNKDNYRQYVFDESPDFVEAIKEEDQSRDSKTSARDTKKDQ